MNHPLDTNQIRADLGNLLLPIEVKELIMRLTFSIDRLENEIRKRDAALLREKAGNKSLRKMMRSKFSAP